MPRSSSRGQFQLGVLSIFNAGFKPSDGPGGLIADHVTFEPMRTNFGTIAISADGSVSIGPWTPTFRAKHADAIELRQNLPLVVAGGRPATSAADPWVWGSPLHGNPHEPRTALGNDAAGNLLFIATTGPALPADLASAAVSAGAVSAVELDMNPEWPSFGLSSRPVHRRGQAFPLNLPGEYSSALKFESSSYRDFFVVVAEPVTRACSLFAPATTAHPAAEPILEGGHC